MGLRHTAAALVIGITTSGVPAAVYAAPSSDRVSQTQLPAIAASLPRTKLRSNPYSRLFPVPGVEAVAQPQPTPRRAPAAEPKVVCGMTLIPADPQIDPRFAIPIPQDGTRFTIRAIEPPVCR